MKYSGILLKNNIKLINYTDLDVWNLAHQCVLEIYKITTQFPSEEKFGLISQLRRAAYSIPANIAEGNGRQHLKEYINFLFISKSSLNELKYFLFLSKDLGYISKSKYNELDAVKDRIRMMLLGLIKSLKRKMEGVPRPKESGKRGACRVPREAYQVLGDTNHVLGES